MAISPKEIKNQYPLPAYNYRVSILPFSLQNLPAGTELGEALLGDFATISCSQVSGLSMETETVTYKHGFSFLTGFHVIPGQRKEVNLTIKKGVTSHSRYMSDWMRLVYPIIAPKPLSLSRKRDILIDLLDEKGEAVVRWVVVKAMPVKLLAPSFDATTNEVAFEELQLIAHQLKVDYITSSELL